MICDQCLRLTKTERITNGLGFLGLVGSKDTEPHVDEEKFFHATYTELTRSQYYCTLCAHLWAQLGEKPWLLRSNLEELTKDAADDVPLEDRPLRVYVHWSKSKKNLCIRFNHYHELDFYKTPRRSRRLAKLAPNFAQSNATRQDLYIPTGYQAFHQRLDYVRQWLKVCCQSHEQCKEYRDRVPWLPTRLVKVSQNAEGILNINLCLTSGLPKETKYLTLSHCWGVDKFETLVSDNIDDYLNNIPFETLSNTFQDALRICVALDLQYIWIDSLCIIQNSEEDWATESALMYRVYSSSYLNIAASGSTKGSEGIFRPWSDKLNKECYFIDTLEEQYTLSDWGVCQIFKQDFITSPLHYRAWVVQAMLSCFTYRIPSFNYVAIFALFKVLKATQELFLAPRTLHFTNLQLYWQCKEHVASSLKWNWRPEMYNGLLIPRTYLSLDKHDCLDKYRSGRGLFEQLWRSNYARLVLEYTSAKLTFTEDKVVAFDGIAEHFRQIQNHSPGEEYIAGHWKSSFPLDLLWSLERSKSIRPLLSMDLGRSLMDAGSSPNVIGRFGATTAPSWSWLSVTGTVSYSCTLDTNWQSCCLLEDVGYNVQRIGRRLYGYLTFVAPIFGIQVNSKQISLAGESTKRLPMCADFDLGTSDNSDGEYICLVLATYCIGDSDPNHKGLLLREAGDEQIKAVKESLETPSGRHYIRHGIFDLYTELSPLFPPITNDYCSKEQYAETCEHMKNIGLPAKERVVII